MKRWPTSANHNCKTYLRVLLREVLNYFKPARPRKMKRTGHAIRFINKKICTLRPILSGMTTIEKRAMKKTLITWIRISAKWNVSLDDSWIPKAYPRMKKLYPNLPHLYEENKESVDLIDNTNNIVNKWLLQIISTKHN